MGLFDIFRKRKIKLICLDLDNTLYDYGAAEAEAESYIAEEIQKIALKKKFKVNTIEILRMFTDVKHSHMHHDTEPEKFSRALWIQETIKKSGIKLNQKLIDYYSTQLEKKYWECLVHKIKLFPNTISTLEALKDSGKYKLATITDSDGRKDIKIDRIKALNLDKFFDFIITTDDTHKNKPAVENWQYLIKSSGIRAEESVMVGDHPEVDLINAKKLGFITVWSKEHINTDMHLRYVDHEITEIKQLVDVLKRYS